MDVGAASMMNSHRTLSIEDFTSDHLPLSLPLLYDVCSSTKSGNNDTLRCKRIDWVQAEKSGFLDMQVHI